MTSLQTIPLNRLVHSKANVRRTGRGLALDGLMASIAAHGLRQNLNVRATSGNRYEVVAGGRRLDALRRLAAAGQVDGKMPVACLVLAEDESPTEVSLAENTQRVEMHPDDQCEAFRLRVEEGAPIEDVAARFGVTPAVVRQRLKLAAVSPVRRAKFRDGELTLAQMMALALVDDRPAQEQAWNNLPEWNRSPEMLRRALTSEGMAADGHVASFVGLEAYEAAGGTVLRNLFEEEAPILADGALVQRLATAKLEADAEIVRAEGWKWVEVELSPSYGQFGRVWPRAAEEGAEPTFAPEDIARAGARVFLGYDGTVRVERGLLDAETVKAERAAEREAEKEEGGSTDLPTSAVTDLTAHRTAALRLELARNTSVALAAVVHALGSLMLYETRVGISCLQLANTHKHLDGLIRTPEEGTAVPALETLTQAWREALPPSVDAFWGWCLSAGDQKLLELLALLAGHSVNAVKGNGGAWGIQLAHADQLAEALNLDMTAHWTPTAEGFFSRLTKPQLASVLTEAGHTEAASFVVTAKKAEGAKRATEALTSTDWLPAPLRA